MIGSELGTSFNRTLEELKLRNQYRLSESVIAFNRTLEELK